MFVYWVTSNSNVNGRNYPETFDTKKDIKYVLIVLYLKLKANLPGHLANLMDI